MAVCMITVVTWLNLDGFRSVLGPDAAARMTNGALVVSLCAALCVSLALVQTRLRRGRRVVAAVFGLVLVASLAGPLYLRGGGEPTPPSPGRVQLVRRSQARACMILSTGHRSRSSRRIRPAADSRTSAAFSTAAP
jgi:hypothetical protein